MTYDELMDLCMGDDSLEALCSDRSRMSVGDDGLTILGESVDAPDLRIQIQDDGVLLLWQRDPAQDGAHSAGGEWVEEGRFSNFSDLNINCYEE